MAGSFTYDENSDFNIQSRLSANKQIDTHISVSLREVSLNRRIGWYLDADRRTVKQVMTVEPRTTRIVGHLDDPSVQDVDTVLTDLLSVPTKPNKESSDV